MQTVEKKFKFLLVDLSHLPLQISKLFKIDANNNDESEDEDNDDDDGNDDDDPNADCGTAI